MASITLRAFAKINLSLRVRDVRPDGFHEVQTILQAIDLYDRITCETRRGAFDVRCGAPDVPGGRGNIVWKAAQELWSAAGRAGEPRDAVVTLEKRIPVRAGLGGGSSNAAAALVVLRRLWKARVTDERLFEIAARLGSDVPYFLVGGTAVALGRGEEVYPMVDLPRLWVVLALPPFGVATQDAYAWLHTKKGVRHLFSYVPTYKKRCLTPFLCVPLGNDLEEPVIERHPVVGQLKQQLTGSGAVLAAMSGSGSTVFGVFTSAAAARAAARTLKQSGVDVRRARFQRRRTP